MMKPARLWVWLLAIFCAPLGYAAPPAQSAPAAPTEAIPPLQTIIDRTLAQADAQHQALKSMQYDQVANVEQLDDNNRTTRHEVLQMLVRPGAHPSMQVVSAKGDNLPTNPDDAQAQGRDVEGNKQTFTLHSLVSRFAISLVGADRIDGEPAYVIAFAPKPNQPYRDETEKVVNQLAGRMWISARTYNVLRTVATLTNPVSVAWFFARIPTLDFLYTMPTDPNAGFAPCRVEITLQVKAFFVGYHVRQTIDMANFRPRPLDAKPSG